MRERTSRYAVAAVALLSLAGAVALTWLGLHLLFYEDDDGARLAIVPGVLALIAAFLLYGWGIGSAAIIVMSRRRNN